MVETISQDDDGVIAAAATCFSFFSIPFRFREDEDVVAELD